MPIHNTWLVPSRISLGYFEGQITIQDIINSQEESSAMYAGHDGMTIHAIMDMRDITKYPTNLSELIHNIMLYKNQQFGWVIIITNSTIIRFLGSAIVQLSKQRFRAFTDVSECLNFLHQMDATLPPLTEDHYETTIQALQLN